MEELTHHLDRLETTGLIRIAQLLPELEYLFRHALVQDAVYASMLRQDRRLMHLSVAVAIESVYPDRAEELAPVLAMHFALGEDDERALHYYTIAADAAAARYANNEAIQMYTRAIEIEKRVPSDKLARLYLGCGKACEFIGDYANALATYTEMETVAHDRGDKPAELAALNALATIRATTTSVHNPAEAERALNAALALSREIGDRATESHVEWNLMLFHKFSGRSEEGVKHGEASLAIARELNLREQMAFTMNDLITHAYLDIGDFASALRLIDEVPLLWQELGNQTMLADSYGSATSLAFFMGDYDRAIALSLKARHISETIGNKWGQSFSRWILGQVYHSRGEVDHALETMRTAIALGEESGFMGAVVGVGGDLAALLCQLGRMDEAWASLAAATTACEQHLPGWLNGVLAVKIALQLHDGDRSGAAATADRLDGMIARGEFMTYPSSRGITWLAMASARLATGDLARAHKALDELDSFVARTGMRAYVPEMSLLRGRTFLAQDDTVQARAAFERSRDAARDIGSRWLEWQALAAIADMSRADGDTATASSLRADAAAIIRAIAATISDPDIRASYLAQPERAAILA